MCPSSGADNCVVLLPCVGIVPWLQEGCTIPTRGNNTVQSSAPEDGHMVARNMLNNL